MFMGIGVGRRGIFGACEVCWCSAPAKKQAKSIQVANKPIHGRQVLDVRGSNFNGDKERGAVEEAT